VAAIVLAVVAGGLAGAYALTQTYYFVGRDGSEVAIFRGVNTQFGPLKFFNVYKNTDLRLNDLTAAVRSQVSDGINARNEGDAERIVTNLHQQLKPLCPMPTPTPTPTPTRSVPSPTHRSTARTVNSPARAAATSSRTPTPTRSPTPTPTITPSPSPTSSVDCRSGS
jgi:protein phosphatase